MSTKNLHIIPRGSGWAVRSSGAERAVKVFENQQDAASFARSLATKASGAEVFVHGRDGMVKSHDSYGRDSDPPKR